jgi:hypothetical protein
MREGSQWKNSTTNLLFCSYRIAEKGYTKSKSRGYSGTCWLKADRCHPYLSGDTQSASLLQHFHFLIERTARELIYCLIVGRAQGRPECSFWSSLRLLSALPMRLGYGSTPHSQFYPQSKYRPALRITAIVWPSTVPVEMMGVIKLSIKLNGS